jgi:hypothetical protein
MENAFSCRACVNCFNHKCSAWSRKKRENTTTRRRRSRDTQRLRIIWVSCGEKKKRRGGQYRAERCEMVFAPYFLAAVLAVSKWADKSPILN